MSWRRRSLAVLALVLAAPLAASAQSVSPQRAYEECIVRRASDPPSPQAAVILQRACFYKFLYAKGYGAAPETAAELRKLSRTYTPEVCDCLFEKIPSMHPDVPAPAVLDYCVKNPKKPPQPEAR
jgi:hypothetical protein